jgi:hypothetical protein
MTEENNFHQELENIKLEDHQTIFSRRWFWLMIILVVAMFFLAIVWIVNKNKVTGPKVQLEQVKTVVKPMVYQAEFKMEEKSGIWVKGKEIEINLVMDTKGNNIVVGQAVVKYDPKVLEYLGDDDKTSKLTMKAIDKHEPGRIELVRAIPGDSNPKDSDDGFTGAGNFITLKFKILQNSPAEINFDEKESMLIVDDGQGTIMQTEFLGVNKTIK